MSDILDTLWKTRDLKHRTFRSIIEGYKIVTLSEYLDRIIYIDSTTILFIVECKKLWISNKFFEISNMCDNQEEFNNLIKSTFKYYLDLDINEPSELYSFGDMVEMYNKIF